MLYSEYEKFPGRVFEKTIRENYTAYYEKQYCLNNRRLVRGIRYDAATVRFRTLLFLFLKGGVNK